MYSLDGRKENHEYHVYKDSRMSNRVLGKTFIYILNIPVVQKHDATEKNFRKRYMKIRTELKIKETNKKG